MWYRDRPAPCLCLTMTLLSILAALLLEQARPLAERSMLIGPLVRYSRFLEDQFNDGAFRHGIVAWLLGVLPATLGLLIVDAFLWRFQPILVLALNVLVLYVTVGFRQFSHFFTDIQLALRMGELGRARQLLADWRGAKGDRLASGEVARLAIEEALVASHRHVFAPLFWFVVLGPGGAMLYRLAMFFDSMWGCRSDAEIGAFGVFSRRAYRVLDWLPLRLTATAFAIVGDFEDAVYCWRTQAAKWPDESSGILLASGGGALGVRLGLPISTDEDVGIAGGDIQDRPELGLGDEADADLMQSAVGLVWRTLVLGLMLVALAWVASWVGH